MGTYLGDGGEPQTGISRVMYTHLIGNCFRQPDRPHELTFDTPLVQNLGPAKAPPPPKPKKEEETGVHLRENDPKPVEGRPLNTQVKLEAWVPTGPDWEMAENKKPAVVGADKLGGRAWDVPEALHQQMLEKALRNEIPLSSVSLRERLLAKRPTYHGPPEWKDPVKHGYIHPDLAAPAGM